MSRLPNRPSLVQLRKQAKELLHRLRNGDLSAINRLRKYKPNVSDPILADAQFVLAREHGFESWPKLVHHIHAAQSPELEQHRRIAEDLVAVYNSADGAAATRLNDLFHTTLNIEQIRGDQFFKLIKEQHRIFVRWRGGGRRDAALRTYAPRLGDLVRQQAVGSMAARCGGHRRGRRCVVTTR